MVSEGVRQDAGGAGAPGLNWFVEGSAPARLLPFAWIGMLLGNLP